MMRANVPRKTLMQKTTSGVSMNHTAFLHHTGVVSGEAAHDVAYRPGKR